MVGWMTGGLAGRHCQDCNIDSIGNGGDCDSCLICRRFLSLAVWSFTADKLGDVAVNKTRAGLYFGY